MSKELCAVGICASVVLLMAMRTPPPELQITNAVDFAHSRIVAHRVLIYGGVHHVEPGAVWLVTGAGPMRAPMTYPEQNGALVAGTAVGVLCTVNHGQLSDCEVQKIA